jgi:hypothetical protein
MRQFSHNKLQLPTIVHAGMSAIPAPIIYFAALCSYLDYILGWGIPTAKAPLPHPMQPQSPVLCTTMLPPMNEIPIIKPH